MPSLQAQPKERLTELFVQLDHEGRGGRDLIDCSFDHDIDHYRNFGAANTKSVGQLLIEFFEFYCRYFDYRTLEVNVRLGGYGIQKEVLKRRSSGRKQLLPGQGEKKLIVMDPFILDRNVAGSCSGRHLTQVWRTFQWLYYQLSLGHHSRAFAHIPESYFLFEMQLREYHQKQASSPHQASSTTTSKATSTVTVSATISQEEPDAHTKPDQPKESAKHGPRHESKTSQKDLSNDSDDSDDDGDEDGQKSGESASKSKTRRVRKAIKYRRRLEAAISEAVQRGDDPSRFSALLAKAPPSILGSDKSNNNDHPSEAGPMREFIRAVAAAIRDSKLNFPPLGPGDAGDTTTTTTTTPTKSTTTTRQNDRRPHRTSQKEKKQQSHQSAQSAKSGSEEKGAGSSSRPLSLQGPKGRTGHQPQKDQKKQNHPDQRTRDQEASLFPVLAKTRKVLPQPPANE